MPKQWQKPAINAVGLPVHAQTSPAGSTTAATTLTPLPVLTLELGGETVIPGFSTLTINADEEVSPAIRQVNLRVSGSDTITTKDYRIFAPIAASLQNRNNVVEFVFSGTKIELLIDIDRPAITFSFTLRPGEGYTVGTDNVVTIAPPTTAAPTTAAPTTAAP